MMEIFEFIEVREIVEGKKKFLEDVCRPMHYHFATAPNLLIKNGLQHST
jgi:hypothetical protein